MDEGGRGHGKFGARHVKHNPRLGRVEGVRCRHQNETIYVRAACLSGIVNMLHTTIVVLAGGGCISFVTQGAYQTHAWCVRLISGSV